MARAACWSPRATRRACSARSPACSPTVRWRRAWVPPRARARARTLRARACARSAGGRIRRARRQRLRGAQATLAGSAAQGRVRRPVVVLLGPSRDAISGVTTHLNGLLGSRLTTRFDLVHFQIGSEGRREGLARRLARLAVSPFALAHTLLSAQAALLHINTSLNAKACWRDLVY